MLYWPHEFTPIAVWEDRLKQRQPDQSQLIRLWTLVIVRVFLIIAAIIILAWLLYELRTVLLLLIFSIFFCYLIAPVVRFFEQPLYVAGRELKLPRAFAILFVYVLIGVVVFMAARFISPKLSTQATDLGDNWPIYKDAATKTLNDADSWMRHLGLPEQWQDYIKSYISQLPDIISSWAGFILKSAIFYLQYLLWLIIVPILSFFLLKDAAAIERGLVGMMPNESLRKRAHWFLLDVSRTIAAYIRAQITACLVVSVLVTFGLALIGAPYAVVLGVLAGVLEFLPLIGPLIAATIIVGLSLTVSIKTAFIVALFLTVLRIAQDYIIYPRIVGHGIKMHPLVIILAILGGAEIAGLVGVFLSIPFMGLMIVVYNHFVALRGLRSIRGPTGADQVEPRPEISSSTPPAPVLEK
jgi:predicted PurR-regulated permease PerM